MTDGTTTVLSKLAALLDMDAEAILAQSLHGFVAEQMAPLQQRISQLSEEHQRFLRQYNMPLGAFLHALEALEEQPEEDVMIRGEPLLEAVADSRWWAHVQADLAAEMAKLELRRCLST
jgi:hypothetical protein